MDHNSCPESTDFLELHGQLVEWSQMKPSLPGAKVRLEEHPPLPEELKPVLKAAGLKDEAEGEASWEVHIELPAPGLDQLSLVVARKSRAKTLRDGKALERLLSKGPLPGSVNAHVLSYPGKDLLVPAMLWADIEAPGVGEISVSTAADNLSRALTLMQQVLPGAKRSA